MFQLESNQGGPQNQVIFLNFCTCCLEAKIWAKKLSEYLGHPFTLVDAQKYQDTTKIGNSKGKRENL